MRKSHPCNPWDGASRSSELFRVGHGRAVSFQLCSRPTPHPSLRAKRGNLVHKQRDRHVAPVSSLAPRDDASSGNRIAAPPDFIGSKMDVSLFFYVVRGPDSIEDR